MGREPSNLYRLCFQGAFVKPRAAAVSTRRGYTGRRGRGHLGLGFRVDFPHFGNFVWAIGDGRMISYESFIVDQRKGMVLGDISAMDCGWNRGHTRLSSGRYLLSISALYNI